MFYGSDEFNSAIENTHGNAPKTRLKFADDEILDLVSSIRYYGGSNDSDDVSIGTTTMARVEVSAYTDKLLTNREFLLEQGIELANGVVEYMPIGYFTIQKPSGDIDQVTFTAYDRMQKFEKPYSSSLAYPTTSILVLDELCQICGIELATAPDNAIEVTENLKGYTCREVLGYIASMYGYFACIDRYGRLNLRWYSDTPIEKSLKKIWHFEKSQDNFEITKVEIVKDSETKYESGNGITTLHNSNPLATQEITDGIFAKLGGFNYSVGEIEMLDDARLDPWDMISVEYYDGKTYKIPCMSLEHNFKAYSTTVKSVGKSESENEYRFTGPTIQYLNRMAADLLVANRVIATKVDAEYVNSVAITTENFDAKVAEIKELIVEEIDGKYANIDLANIDIANINVGKIGELFAKVGLIDRATIVEGHITGFLDAVEVNANKITAGTLIADRILLSGGEEGVLYALNNLGELTSTNVDTLDGYVLTDRTINADKLIANSITANELDVNQIFGNEAVLNKLVSQEIFSDAVAANTVVVGVSKDAKDALDLANSTNTASGSPILLTDSADGTLIDFRAYGRSTQNGTPTPDSPVAIKSVADGGYFDGELMTGFYSATGSYVQQSAYVCSKNPIPCNGDDTVKIIYNTIADSMAFVFYDENMTFISRVYTSSVTEYEETAPTNAKYFHFYIGGSSNPISPSTAKKIVVTINDTYALIIKSVGKNLLNIRESDKDTTNLTYSKYTNEYVKATALTSDTGTFLCSYSAYLEKDKTYIFSHENASLSQIYIYSDKLWGNLIITTNIIDNPKYTHIAESGKYIIAYYIGMDALALGTEYSVVKPMLRLAEVTDINYKPYTESVNTIALSEPLRSAGAVKDEVSPTEVTKRFAEVVFDGSDDEVISVFGSTYPHLFVISVSGVKRTTSNIVCSHFLSYANAGSDYSKNMIYSLDNQIFINHIDITTVDEFKAWLKANPITVVYELTEPIVEAIEPVDINTYNNVTYLTSGDDAEMKVKYYRNTPTGIQLAKLADIEQDNSRLIANWASDNDVTLIDGAKIYTGSITADKLEVNSLSAINANLGTVTAGKLRSSDYDEDTGSGMSIDLNNSTIESVSEDFVTIFNSQGHYGSYIFNNVDGLLFSPDFDTMTGQANLSISNGQLALNNVKYNSYGISYGGSDIINWTTEGIATPKLSTDLIYCNGEMVAKTVKAETIQNAMYNLTTVGNMAVKNKQDIATIKQMLRI